MAKDIKSKCLKCKKIMNIPKGYADLCYDCNLKEEKIKNA